MSERKPKHNLKHLPYSPTVNPLMSGFVLHVKQRQVRTGGARDLIDQRSGEVHRAVIIEEMEVDDSQFVKVFAAGVRAAFGLSQTGARVFQAVLDAYQKAPLSGGFVDCVYLHFFDGGLDGRALDMSDRTFRRGLVELLDKKFLAPRGESLFWVNPDLFFRGDRATFVKSYYRVAGNRLTADAEGAAGDSGTE